ncbi:MAG: MBOAT family protein [Magnetococcales bacterium]|nr:MBOAT family protein [Magnetococcales bacterium]
MLFIEFRFIVFFIIVWLVFWSLRSNTLRKWLLLIGSYVFYASWDYRFLSLILIATATNHIAAIRIQDSSERTIRLRWLTSTIVINIGILFVFKYLNFFADSLVDLINVFGGTASPTLLNIILPVGISFYTFQSLSYPLDVYQRKMEPSRSWLDFSLFVAFFPQLVAGPIVRAKEFMPQLAILKTFAEIPVRACLTLFLIGFAKKAVVADGLAPFLDPIYENPAAYSSLDIFYGQLLYSIQVYCDFSGYSDMAIASAGLLGYKLPLNFNFPYFSASLADFWRRWHISLSSWLHDYLYLPLFFMGKNRFSKIMVYRNVIITMLLCGLWHGAAWGYIIFGLFHGLALVVAQEWQSFTKRGKITIPFSKAIGIATTFYFVCWTFVLFRTQDMNVAWHLTVGHFFSNIPSSETLPSAAPALFIFLAIVHTCFYRWDLPKWFANLKPWIFSLSAGAVAAFLVAMVPVGYRPFIYFQF